MARKRRETAAEKEFRRILINPQTAAEEAIAAQHVLQESDRIRREHLHQRGIKDSHLPPLRRGRTETPVAFGSINDLNDYR